MMTPWMKQGLRLVGAVVLSAALSGCIVYPYGPRGGYYHPHYYYY